MLIRVHPWFQPHSLQPNGCNIDSVDGVGIFIDFPAGARLPSVAAMKLTTALEPITIPTLHLNGRLRRLNTTSIARNKIRLSTATEQDRQTIYKLRHEVYASELHQHPINAQGELTDSLDASNVYLVASIENEIVGFVSITPPTADNYSIDKYVDRAELRFTFDDKLYEVRLLTVRKPWRGRPIAALLMCAAFRWVEARGGTRIVAIGRREILDLYLKVGLQKIGIGVRSGAVDYEFLQAPVGQLREGYSQFSDVFNKIEAEIDWGFTFALNKPASCFHGGAFFKTIGERFDAIEKRESIINADVLDAWFPPSPRLMSALTEHLPWLLRTSPPTGCDGLIDVIAESRGVNRENILPGAGSSDLIFLALRHWLKPSSRVLILDPTYGEYAHVLEKVIGCKVDRFTLRRAENYAVDLVAFEAQLENAYDLVILVNPNSPTGRHVSREKLQSLLLRAPRNTRFWIDETYIEFAGMAESVERFAANSENVVVCKSMSKAYALSGARVAYLCGSPHLLEDLRAITPPWAVSLLGQVAAVKALQDAEYYTRRYAETHALREQLKIELELLGFEVVPSIANYLLCHLPQGASAAEFVDRARAKNLFLRDAAKMGTYLGSDAIRIAVKDAETNKRMIGIVMECLE